MKIFCEKCVTVTKLKIDGSERFEARALGPEVGRKTCSRIRWLTKIKLNDGSGRVRIPGRWRPKVLGSAPGADWKCGGGDYKRPKSSHR